MLRNSYYKIHIIENNLPKNKCGLYDLLENKCGSGVTVINLDFSSKIHLIAILNFSMALFLIMTDSLNNLILHGIQMFTALFISKVESVKSSRFKMYNYTHILFA